MLTTTGKSLCFGSGAAGLGTDSSSDVSGPGGPLLSLQPYIAFSDTAKPISAIFPGGHHTCAIRCDSQVLCFGTNTGGALGKGDTTFIGFALGDMVTVAPIAFNPALITLPPSACPAPSPSPSPPAIAPSPSSSPPPPPAPSVAPSAAPSDAPSPSASASALPSADPSLPPLPSPAPPSPAPVASSEPPAPSPIAPPVDLPPSVTALTPTSGPMSGGTTVTLFGSKFGSAPGDLIGLRLGATKCTIRTYVANDRTICLSGEAASPSLVKPQVMNIIVENIYIYLLYESESIHFSPCFPFSLVR